MTLFLIVGMSYSFKKVAQFEYQNVHLSLRLPQISGFKFPDFCPDKIKFPCPKKCQTSQRHPTTIYSCPFTHWLLGETAEFSTNSPSSSRKNIVEITVTRKSSPSLQWYKSAVIFNLNLPDYSSKCQFPLAKNKTPYFFHNLGKYSTLTIYARQP